MLQSVFLWFYCLPIRQAVLLLIMISAVYLVLRPQLVQKYFWYPALIVVFLFWLGVIAFATIMDRTPSGEFIAPQLLPLHSYRTVLAGGNIELLRSNFMNVALFYPAGLLACELLP